MMTDTETRPVIPWADQLRELRAEVGRLLTRVSELEQQRTRQLGRVCPDCRGTFWTTDDGSVTGTPGARIPCVCCDPAGEDLDQAAAEGELV